MLRRGQPYQLPPISLIACNSARLLSVRLVPSLRGAEGDAAIQGGSALSSPWRTVMALDCFVAALLAMTVNAGIGRIYFPSMCSR